MAFVMTISLERWSLSLKLSVYLICRLGLQQRPDVIVDMMILIYWLKDPIRNNDQEWGNCEWDWLIIGVNSLYLTTWPTCSFSRLESPHSMIQKCAKRPSDVKGTDNSPWALKWEDGDCRLQLTSTGNFSHDPTTYFFLFLLALSKSESDECVSSSLVLFIFFLDLSPYSYPTILCFFLFYFFKLFSWLFLFSFFLGLFLSCDTAECSLCWLLWIVKSDFRISSSNVIYEVWFVWLFQNVAAWALMREAFFARCVVYKCSTVSHDILVPDDGVESPSPSDSCDSQVTSASTRLAIPSTDRSIMAALLWRVSGTGAVGLKRTASASSYNLSFLKNRSDGCYRLCFFLLKRSSEAILGDVYSVFTMMEGSDCCEVVFPLFR